MLVVRSWVMLTFNVKYDNMVFRRVTYKWRGYFLLGIIPLCLVNYETLYTE